MLRLRALATVLIVLHAAPTDSVAALPDTQYLIFQLFTTPMFPIFLNRTQMDYFINNAVSAFGVTGSPQRKLGFSIGPMSLDMTDQEVVDTITGAFAMADKYDVAIMFHWDDSMFWITRPDLYNSSTNVEWADWNRTLLSPPRTLPWFIPTMAPQMCYNSPRIQQEITRVVSQVAAPLIISNVARLTAAGRAHIFAGIIVGWETMLPLVSPPLGYCALSNLGYSATNPPPDMDGTLTNVVHDFLGFWAQQFIAAGINQTKLFTHIATQPRGTYDNHAPLTVAFTNFTVAGFTVYGSGVDGFGQVYEQLAVQSNKQWGLSESSNLFPPNALPGGSGQPDMPMSQFLSSAFQYSSPATYVNLFGLPAANSAYFNVLMDPTAISAYRQFLTGSLSPSPPAPPSPSSSASRAHGEGRRSLYTPVSVVSTSALAAGLLSFVH